MQTKHNVGHPLSSLLSSPSPTACIISTRPNPKRKNQSNTCPRLNFLLFITTTSFCSPFLKALSMDWYSWLSKSGLEPSLVYDYSLLFAHNELEEEDIVHFDHEFLLSMGISIAKHRLEILKLAKKLQKRTPPRPVARLLSAVIKAKKCLARYFNPLAPGRDRSAIVVVPKPAGAGGGTGRWKGTILKRNRRLVRLMITDGGVKVRKPPEPGAVSHSASPMVDGGAGGAGGDGFWGSGEEEIRWDSMFQNLKPT